MWCLKKCANEVKHGHLYVSNKISQTQTEQICREKTIKRLNDEQKNHHHQVTKCTQLPLFLKFTASLDLVASVIWLYIGFATRSDCYLCDSFDLLFGSFAVFTVQERLRQIQLLILLIAVQQKRESCPVFMGETSKRTILQQTLFFTFFKNCTINYWVLLSRTSMQGTKGHRWAKSTTMKNEA